MPQAGLEPGHTPDEPRGWRSAKVWIGEYRLLIVTVLLAASVALGYWGFSVRNDLTGEKKTPLTIVYLSLQLISMNSGAVPPPVPWQLQVARFLAPAVTASAVILALLAIFKTQLGRLRLRFMRDHVVICGLGRKGLHLARSFFDAGDRIVVIEKSAQNDNLSFCENRGIKTIIGDARDGSILKRALIHRAKHIFLVCDSDGVNAQTAILAQGLVAGRAAHAVTCFVHIFDLELCRLLREQQVHEHNNDLFRIEFFNVFEAGARAMLDRYTATLYSPRRAGRPPTLVVFGIGRLGESLIVRAIRDWRQYRTGKNDKLRITAYDRQATRKIEGLKKKYPRLNEYCELTAREAEVVPQEFRSGEMPGLGSDVQPTVAFICLDDECKGLSLGLALRHRFIESGIEAPIVVRTEERVGLARMLSADGHRTDEYRSLFAFGLIDFTCNKEIVKHGVAEKLARSIHETYVLRQLQKGDTVEKNPSLVPWEELDDDLRGSNFAQADHFVERLAALDYSIIPLSDWEAEDFKFPADEIGKMAEIEHERWCKYMTSKGWTYAPGKKDKEKKTHPDLMPWASLAETAREKDRETVADLPVFLAQVGFQIVRIRRPG